MVQAHQAADPVKGCNRCGASLKVSRCDSIVRFLPPALALYSAASALIIIAVESVANGPA